MQRQQEEGGESADVVSAIRWKQQPVNSSDIQHDGPELQLKWL